MVEGTIDCRTGNEKRTMNPTDVAVIPGGVEHEAYFPEDSEVIDFFAPVREDFLTSAPILQARALRRAFADYRAPWFAGS